MADRSRRCNPGVHVFGLLLAVVSIVLPAWADQAQLNPSKDNTLYESATGSFSNGKGTGLFSGRTSSGQLRRAVIRFDLSGIPQEAIVSSASLMLTENSPGDNGPQTTTVHRLLKDWGEGTSNAGGAEGQGTPSTTGDATWIHAFFNTDSWSAQGGDFSAAASASMNVNKGPVTWTSAGLAADVQSWISDPSTNWGWLVKGNELVNQTAQRFGSRESSTPPVLIVEFSVAVPPDPGTLSFSSDQLEVVESAQSASLGVTRANGTDGAVSVTFSTVADTALAGEDFAASSGTLDWADGEGGTKTILIPVVDDAGEPHFEGVEQFTVTLSDPQGGAILGGTSSAVVRIIDEEDLIHRAYFPQFGNGAGFFSQISVLNPWADRSAFARLTIRTESGEPFPVALNGELVPDGLVEFGLPAGGLELLVTDATGTVTVGTVTVESDVPVNSLVVFGGVFGLAGVQASGAFSAGFTGPVEVRANPSIRTGLAIQNLEPEAVEVLLELADASGGELAEATVLVPAMGQVARFVDEVFAGQGVSFADFTGSVRTSTARGLAAVMIQNRLVGSVSQFATLPVSGRQKAAEAAGVVR